MLEMDQKTKSLNLVLLGKTGAGKSSSGNSILGREAFISKKSAKSVTRDVAVESGTVGSIPVTVYDTPGLFDPDMSEEEILKILEKVILECESRRCVFLLVIKADRFTKEEREAVEKIEELLGENRIKNTWILFTRGDELEEDNVTINEFINETEPLKKLVQKYNQRYHVFNNKTKESSEQVQGLLTEILKTYIYSLEEIPEILKPDALMRKIPGDFEPDTPVSNLSSRRIVLLGKTGVGKSAAGNTILGQKEFISLMRMNSVTRECLEKQTTVSGRSVSVVDTPGFFDTQMNPEDLAMKIAESIYESSPGPHAFLIVFRVDDRFTEHEQQIPQMIEMMFGQEVLKYSIILFTHGDNLQRTTVEELIKGHSRLRHLVDQCGGRFHVFNNKDQSNRKQVNDLLKKIDSMIEQNGGGHYSNQMLEDAQRFRQEEEEQRKREEEERKRQGEKERQDEEKRKQEEIERVITETEERVRAEINEGNKQEKGGTSSTADPNSYNKPKSGFARFLSKYWPHILIGAVVLVVCTGIGAAVGTGIAAKAGAAFLKGAAIGAAIGAGVGGVADLVAGVYFYKNARSQI